MQQYQLHNGNKLSLLLHLEDRNVSITFVSPTRSGQTGVYYTADKEIQNALEKNRHFNKLFYKVCPLNSDINEDFEEDKDGEGDNLLNGINTLQQADKNNNDTLTGVKQYPDVIHYQSAVKVLKDEYATEVANKPELLAKAAELKIEFPNLK